MGEGKGEKEDDRHLTEPRLLLRKLHQVCVSVHGPWFISLPRLDSPGPGRRRRKREVILLSFILSFFLHTPVRREACTGEGGAVCRPVTTFSRRPSMHNKPNPTPSSSTRGRGHGWDAPGIRPVWVPSNEPQGDERRNSISQSTA